jgi:DNA repair photolyase
MTKKAMIHHFPEITMDSQEITMAEILRPTSIELGDYVINPYVGCEFACIYCYVRSNRSTLKRKQPWGTYADVRTNAADLLEKELAVKKPTCVLLGSTTECFQPIEKKWGITQKILEVLNQHHVEYVILTRSPYIVEYLPLLTQGFCRKIYFTINQMQATWKALFEPKSPSFELRSKAISILVANKMEVIPYFCPILPGISSIPSIFSLFPEINYIEWECLNFNLSNIAEIISLVGTLDANLQQDYKKMQSDPVFYQAMWEKIQQQIKMESQTQHKSFYIHCHAWGKFFQNKY